MAWRSDSSSLLQILESHGAESFTLLSRLTLQPHVAEDLLQDSLRFEIHPDLLRHRISVAYVFRSAITSRSTGGAAGGPSKVCRWSRLRTQFSLSIA